jgi:hypothetical protein
MHVEPSKQRRRRYACEFHDRYGLLALALYAAASILFFGRGVLSQLSTAQIGKSSDPQLVMWFLAWWPHAIANHLNPFFSQAVFAPAGVNIGWTTGIPILSFMAAPITVWFGPIVSYNVLCMLCPALAGWATFILCRAVTGAWWPSLMGGYLFGFSSYMVGQAAAHLAILPVFPIPLFAWWALLGLRGHIRGLAVVAGLTLALVAQFLCEIEIFATMTMFVAIGAILSLMFTSGDRRQAMLGMLKSLAQSYALTLLLVSPYLYFLFSSRYRTGPIIAPLFFSTDVRNFLLPTQAMELGRLKTLEGVTSRFPGNIFESTGYIGLPLALVAAAFARNCWRDAWGKTLVCFTIIAAVLSLGPFLLIGGQVLSPAPAGLLLFLPMIDKALPGRFTVYTFLALAVMAAVWLHTSKTPRLWRGVVALTIVLSMLPNLSAKFWTTPLTIPRFFTEGSYRKYLEPGENVLVLPWGDLSDADLWQLRAGWWFRLAGGYVGGDSVPDELRSWPIFHAFQQYASVVLPEPDVQLKSFLASHGVSVIILDDRYRAVWGPLLATLGEATIEVGGVTLYRLPSVELAHYSGAKGGEMELRARRVEAAALVVGADKYLGEKGASALVFPGIAALRSYHLMPDSWITIPRRLNPPWSQGGLNTGYGLGADVIPYGLAALPGGLVEVYLGGSYGALRRVAKDYRSVTAIERMDFISVADHNLEVAECIRRLLGASVEWPDPAGPSGARMNLAKYIRRLFALSIGAPQPSIISDPPDSAAAWLTMTFARAGLARAARRTSSLPSTTTPQP